MMTTSTFRPGNRSPDRRSPDRRSRLRSGTRLAGLSVALALFMPGIAAAQVFNPPQLPQEPIVFTERDFVSIDGFEPNADLLVRVNRAGEGRVGLARGRTDADGFLEVNHPGGVCWIDVTPDIVPGDVVRITYRNTNNNRNRGFIAGSGAALNAQDVTAEQAFDAGDGTVVIRGTARRPNGNRIPLSRLEVRIINPDFNDTRIGRRDIRADNVGGRVGDIVGATGDLSYDGPGLTTFTAVFTGLNVDERLLATEGQTRVLAWQDTTADGDRLGITIHEVGEVGGPGIGGCPDGPGGPVAAEPPNAPVAYDPAALYDAANPSIQSFLREAVVFSERDFISIEGFDAGTELQVVVRRPNLSRPVIGTARGTVDRSGLFEVNHPGGVCWTGQTPDIRPGDLVDVFSVADGVFFEGQTQRVIDAVVTRAAFVNNAGDLRVNGSARNPDGSAFPLDLLEQRIINPDFNDTRIGRRDIRADVDGGRLENVPGGSGRLLQNGTTVNWRAIYRGLTSGEQQLAVAGQSRVLAWLSTNDDGDRFGITIFEAGEIGGPGFGGCPTSGNFSIQLP